MRLFAPLLLASSSLTAAVVNGQSLPNPVQTYLVPLPETEVFTTLSTLYPQTSGNIINAISVAVASDSTIVYYDHWEDGYEADVTTPTQSTTEIWGDGNIANGAPPGVTTDAADILSGGMAIVLDAAINTTETRGPLDPVNYDGRDRIQASLPIAVTRFAYAVKPGSVLSGAVEVLEQASWGRKYVAPIGTDTTSQSVSDRLCRLVSVLGRFCQSQIVRTVSLTLRLYFSRLRLSTPCFTSWQERRTQKSS